VDSGNHRLAAQPVIAETASFPDRLPLPARPVRLSRHLHDYYQTGDTRDRDLWHEYARATRGLAAVRWSRGSRNTMLGPAAEMPSTDEELAAENVNDELVAIVEIAAWSRIRLAGPEHAVLVGAERGGLAAVNALISQAGLSSHPPH
jgi:hypothetical protein